MAILVASILLVIGVACGGGATPTPVVVEKVVEVVRIATPTPTPVPARLPGVLAESGKKRGGIFTIAGTAATAHFDIHQSASAANLEPQSPMYNTLTRLSPYDGATSILPDLAHSWKISDDGLSYTFFLRDGVKFHDGALLTAEDVVATWTKIVSPPEGIVSAREALFRAINEVKAVDPLTVEFKLSSTSPPLLRFMSADANVIVRKKTLEDNNNDLKRVNDFPGTGAFRFREFLAGEKWVLERNEDYWNDGLPYVDELIDFHVEAGKRGAAAFAGRADLATGATPEVLRRALEQGFGSVSFPITANLGLWMNNERSPYNDVRVRRAIDLAIDRQVLIDAVEEIRTFKPGRWLAPGTAFAPTDEALLAKLPFSPDRTQAIAEAKRLMAEAGYADGLRNVDFMVRDVPFINIQAEAAQLMLKRHLNIDTNLRVSHRTVWFEDARIGDWDITLGVLSATTFDPSDMLNNYYRTGSPQNFSNYSNKGFDFIMDQVDQEPDLQRRVELALQAQEILDEDVPRVGCCFIFFHWIWQSHVKDVPDRKNAGSSVMHRWDTIWLDK